MLAFLNSQKFVILTIFYQHVSELIGMTRNFIFFSGTVSLYLTKMLKWPPLGQRTVLCAVYVTKNHTSHAGVGEK